MKKIILFSLLFFFSTKIVFAQQVFEQVYDCSSTGKCIEKNGQNNALYANNLVPGTEIIQHWNIVNNSEKTCRVYLRLRSLDKVTDLPRKIYLSAVGYTNDVEKQILKSTQFSKLLEKQSIYLGKIPRASSAKIDWTILLDTEVNNEYQGLRKNFSTVLYSYCLGEKVGKVAGVSIDKNKEVVEKLAYSTLSLASLGALLWIKNKS